MSVSVTHKGHFSIVEFSNPPMNLMTLSDMRDLIQGHQQADSHPETRVILTKSGVDDFYSNGLDPNYVLALSNAQRVEVFQGVADLFCALVHLNKPHLTLVNGPAMAGGAILALTADYRFFEQDKGRISFSEPKVGLPIPSAICKAIEAVVARKYVRNVVMMAANLDAAGALEVGLADGVGQGQAAEDQLMDHAKRLARLSPSVMRETKAAVRQEVRSTAEAFARELGVFASFVGDAFLGEGLSALVEGRHPNFVR